MPRGNDNLYRRENRILVFRYKDRHGSGILPLCN
jgi:hypothetical protein